MGRILITTPCQTSPNSPQNPQCHEKFSKPSLPHFPHISFAFPRALKVLAGPFPGSCTGRISCMPIISLAATGIQGGLPALWQRSLGGSRSFRRSFRLRRSSQLPQLLPLAQLRHGAAQGRNPGSLLRVHAAAVAAHLLHDLTAHGCPISAMAHQCPYLTWLKKNMIGNLNTNAV